MSSSISDNASKISCARGCDHQLPTMVSFAIASATLGTGPFAEASTTPCFSTNLIQLADFFEGFFAAALAAFLGADFLFDACFFGAAFFLDAACFLAAPLPDFAGFLAFCFFTVG